MNKIAVALFSNRSQAEPIQQRLAQAGIVAEINEELVLQRLWFVSKQSAGVHIEVAANQFEQAERLLAAWDVSEGALNSAIRCPECKSLRVDYPQFAHNSVLTNMAAGLAAELGLVEKDYYCEACHYTWPQPKAIPPRQRLHMAPYYFIDDVQKPDSASHSSRSIGHSAAPQSSLRKDSQKPSARCVRIIREPDHPCADWSSRSGSRNAKAGLRCTWSAALSIIQGQSWGRVR